MQSDNFISSDAASYAATNTIPKLADNDSRRASYSNRAFLSVLPFSSDVGTVSQLPLGFELGYRGQGADVVASSSEDSNVRDGVGFLNFVAPSLPGNSIPTTAVPLTSSSTNSSSQLIHQYHRHLMHNRNMSERAFDPFTLEDIQNFYEDATSLYNKRNNTNIATRKYNLTFGFSSLPHSIQLMQPLLRGQRPLDKVALASGQPTWRRSCELY
jgi:hypothetical protein